MNSRPRHGSNALFRHSLAMMIATGIGHAGNYIYHMVAGRMMSANEYGLLMALFGAVNVVLLPMAALHLALGRAFAVGARQGAAPRVFRLWFRRLLAASAALTGLALALAPRIQEVVGVERLAPVLLAACVPAFNLFLVLTGAGLQGLQRFSLLALRGGVLFGTRALLIGLCLGVGFRAAGWALLAHLLGMAAAFGFSLWGLRHDLRPRSEERPAPAASPPVGKNALAALPVLAAFALLMTGDVLLVRAWFPADVSGHFAQAATLGRMILWLPLPIANAMFPKVVRTGSGSSEHRKTALQAVGITLALTALALAGAWGLAPWGFRLVYGIAQPSAEQIDWLRRIALAMAPLPPLHVWIHYELARGSIRRLWPVPAGAILFLALAAFAHPDIPTLARALQAATLFALLGSALTVALRPSRRGGSTST